MLRGSGLIRPLAGSTCRAAPHVPGLTFLSTKSHKKSPSTFAQKIKVFDELSKFRLSSLVVVTTSAGFVLAGGPVDLCTLAAASVGTGLCAASAATFNQVVEKDIDASMKRTLSRPLPSGAISSSAASAFGVLTGAGGVGLLAATTNPATALLGLGNIALYSGIYTLSKRHTELNTWIGSLVGAVPPVMGWLAATHHLTQPGTSTALTQMAAQDPLFFPSLMQYGMFLTGEPIALATLLFLWQFPHFFALSWLYREDYQRGGFQMVACNDPTGSRSAALISQYSLYLTAFPIVTSVMGYTSYMYSVEGTAANLYLLYLAQKFNKDQSNFNARKIFLCSLWYLPLLLAGFVFHSRVWNTVEEENKDKVLDQSGSVVHLTDSMLAAKEQMKGLCVHEMLTNKEHLCAKIGSEKAAESAANAVSGVGEVIADPQTALLPNEVKK